MKKINFIDPATLGGGGAAKDDEIYEGGESKVLVLGTKAEFDDAINKECLTVVDFCTRWCPPCKKIAPKFEELSLVETDV